MIRAEDQRRACGHVGIGDLEFLDYADGRIENTPDLRLDIARSIRRHRPDGAVLQVTLRYPDGSLGTVTYTTGGHPRFPKETLDVTGGGRSARLDNFTRTSVWTPSGRHGKRAVTHRDKGQAAMLDRFVDAVRRGHPMPIGLDSLVATSRATIAVGRSISVQGPVKL